MVLFDHKFHLKFWLCKATSCRRLAQERDGHNHVGPKATHLHRCHRPSGYLLELGFRNNAARIHTRYPYGIILRLFEKYPDYRFSFEGSYRYELMEEYYPEEFEKLKEHVAQGRWNVTGSAYENGDVNIPSPEALFRNILYGNSYFDKTFGKRSTDIFLPDCFGFGWALPSIARARKPLRLYHAKADLELGLRHTL